MTDEQFDAFLDECYAEMERKQECLHEKFRIGEYGEFWFDQDTRLLQFKNDGVVMLEFEVTCVGTWSPNSNTWMWAWVNKSMTPEVRHDSERLKELKEVTGFGAFENPGFECDEAMAYENVAFAVHQLDALGMYRIPGERSHLYLAIIAPHT